MTSYSAKLAIFEAYKVTVNPKLDEYSCEIPRPWYTLQECKAQQKEAILGFNQYEYDTPRSTQNGWCHLMIPNQNKKVTANEPVTIIASDAIQL